MKQTCAVGVMEIVLVSYEIFADAIDTECRKIDTICT
jgi:hypothetical protein